MGKERNPYVRTINNTLNKPDVKFTSEGREFSEKKYKNRKTGKDFMDWIITENGDIVSKYPTTTNHIANQIKKSSQNMSLRGDIPVGYDGVTYTQLPNGTTNNIPSIGEYVNKKTFIQIMRGDINPSIIGYGFVCHDAETNRHYVSIDSEKYFINEITAAVLPSFTVKYDIADSKATVATVFTSDKFAGYQAMAGIEDDVKIMNWLTKIRFYKWLHTIEPTI